MLTDGSGFSLTCFLLKINDNLDEMISILHNIGDNAFFRSIHQTSYYLSELKMYDNQKMQV
jgi:hypothetical protein